MEETAEERLESVLNHPDWFIRSPTIHETERKKCQKEDIIHFEIQTDKQSKQKNLETRRKNGEINNEEHNLNHPEWFQRSKILYQKTEEDDNNKSMTKETVIEKMKETIKEKGITPEMKITKSWKPQENTK